MSDECSSLLQPISSPVSWERTVERSIDVLGEYFIYIIRLKKAKRQTEIELSLPWRHSHHESVAVKLLWNTDEWVGFSQPSLQMVSCERIISWLDSAHRVNCWFLCDLKTPRKLRDVLVHEDRNKEFVEK